MNALLWFCAGIASCAIVLTSIYYIVLLPKSDKRIANAETRADNMHEALWDEIKPKAPVLKK